MSNMSYCRFENTSRDLRDCIDYLTKAVNNEINTDEDNSLEDLSQYEKSALTDLIDLAHELIEEFDTEEILNRINSK